nr:GA-binding protein subunit beta-2-like [Hydra vulgaris]
MFSTRMLNNQVISIILSSDWWSIIKKRNNSQRTSKKGLLSIHMAIAEGHANVTSILLSRSAEQINARCAIGRTALHFAAVNKHLDLVQLLLGQGAEIDAQVALLIFRIVKPQQ